MKKFYKFVGFSALLPGALLLSGCVDDNYDLTKDLDLTVELGGDHLTLPASSTDRYTMAQILDVDNNSSIVADAQGNYCLMKDGDHTSSTVSIEDVELNDINNQEDHVKNTTLPKGPFNAGEVVTIHMTGENPSANTKTERYIKKLDNKINLNASEVTKDLISVSKVFTNVKVDVILQFVFGSYTGDVVVKKGYTIEFSKDMTVTCSDATMSKYIEVVDGHILRFKSDYVCSKPISGVAHGRTFTIPVNVTEIVVSKPNGIIEGSPKNKFKFNADVYSQGDLELDASKLSTTAEDNLDIDSYTDVIGTPMIKKVVGKVNPKIDIDPSEFNISDIPSFLHSGDNNLDLVNPQMYLTVNNTSPVQALVRVVFTSIEENGSKVVVNVGDPKKNEYPIVVEPGMNYICVSNKAVSNATILANLGVSGSGATVKNITNFDLSPLMNTIPEKIFVNPEAKANTEVEYTFELGHSYKFESDSKAVVPLEFGPNLVIDYTDKDDDWDSDLHKYNFKTAVIDLQVINTIPMDLDFDVEPIFNKNVAESGAMGDVKVKTEGKIAGTPTIGTPTTSPLKVTLTSEGGNLNGLDGIEFRMKGTGSSALAGQCLNENQYIKFDSIKITIEGGIVIDLNDDDK